MNIKKQFNVTTVILLFAFMIFICYHVYQVNIDNVNNIKQNKDNEKTKQNSCENYLPGGTWVECPTKKWTTQSPNVLITSYVICLIINPLLTDFDAIKTLK